MINKIHLAPMAGVTDLTFRLICKDYGADGLTTEMVSAKGLYFGNKQTADLMRLDEREKPAAIQIFGSDPDIIAEIVPQVVGYGAASIDINMGCPMPKIVNNGDGSALMKNPSLAGEIVRKAAYASSIPITVKIRKGWDRDTAAEFAKVLEANGAAAITVHGRTREQLYQGKADWDTIRAVKKAVKIPVIGNGDIFTAADARRMLEYTGCDGVMVGRGAQGNPFIFRQIKEYFETGTVTYFPSHRDKLNQALEHVKILCAEKGENCGVKEARKHIAWYIKGIPHSSELKNKVFTVTALSDMVELLESAAQSLC
ncbi:MAG: tRNA dihydrouridine synthase DusB [Clostridiales bacterium]|nr:tRNA dihydrouridine synthase DusB [Clostridiales bacterium]